MKATELRIGNLAQEITPSHNKTVFVSVEHFEQIEDGEIDLFPIPLTEEWLLKFGINYIHEVAAYCDDNCMISETNETLDYWVFMPFCTNDEDCYIKIKYVHQLQNLYFALTGKELEVKP